MKYYEFGTLQTYPSAVMVSICISETGDTELVKQLEKIKGVYKIIENPYSIDVWAGKLYRHNLQLECEAVLDFLEYFPYSSLTP